MLNRSLLRGGWLEVFDLPSVSEALNADIAKLAEDNREFAPAPSEVFAAFYLTPLDKIKVVIVGQDPYHSVRRGETNVVSKYHAHGLCFSTKRSSKFIPPSLHNIYSAEPLRDRQYDHGSLVNWALDGVLMLNTALTVVLSKANSHEFWNNFTDAIIGELGKRADIIFMLWGAKAQKKKALISASNVLEWRHPSPMSNNPVKGTSLEFKKCDHFIKCAAIDWSNLDDIMMVIVAKNGHSKLAFETISDAKKVYNFAEEQLSADEMFLKYLPVVHCVDVKVIKIFVYTKDDYNDVLRNTNFLDMMKTINNRTANVILVDNTLSAVDNATLTNYK